jgi:outer membrane protein assembly factor BamB
MKSAVFLLMLFVCTTHLVAADNWAQFRGPGARGQSDDLGLPARWSPEENIRWKCSLPGRGWSSPVVWGDRIFLTSVINEGTTEPAKKGLYFGGNRADAPTTVHRWMVYCVDLSSGKLLWEAEAHRGVPSSPRHLKNSYASETPVVDNDRLYVYFGNLGVFCYTHDGTLVWSKSMEPRPTRFGWGTAASPVLHEDRLIIVNDNDQDSTLMTLDKHTGNELWHVSRDEKSNWATPFVWENEHRTEVITPGSGKIRSYGLNGDLLYELGGCSSITIATPYSAFGLLYVSSGYVMDEQKPIFAIRPGASGDISLADDQTRNEFIVWCQKQAAPYNPTTIVYGEYLYVLLDRGFLSCYEAKTGKLVYEPQRLPRGMAFTASPFAYGDKIFCLNEDGITFVVQAGPEFKLLGTNPLDDGEMCMATPAIAGDNLLIRTEQRLVCVGTQ